nr:tegument protein VP22 [Human alphaherpesvirus 3]
MASSDGDRLCRSNAVRRKTTPSYSGQYRTARRSVVVGPPDDSDDSLGYITTVGADSPSPVYADLYFEHKNTTPRVHQPNDSSGSEDDFEDIDEVVAAFREARLRHELVEDAVYENPLSVEKPSRSFTKNAAVKPKLEDSPKRAPPGAGAIASGRPISFSTAPKTATSSWCGPTPSYNKRVFCEAVRRVAAMQAQKAAEAAWNSNPPRNNAELDRLLTGAVIRITVHEGLNLIQAANEADLGEGASVSKRGHNRKTGDLQGGMGNEPMYAQVRKPKSRTDTQTTGSITNRSRARSASRTDARK